jgi:hypothetical protein
VAFTPLESSRSCHLGFKLRVEKSDAVGDRFF